MELKNRISEEQNPIQFLNSQYSGFFVYMCILMISSAFIFLLEPYIPEMPHRVLASSGAGILIVFLYGSIAKFAHHNGGSALGFIFRMTMFFVFIAICIILFLMNWKYGLTGLLIFALIFLLLQEKSKDEVRRQYSTHSMFSGQNNGSQGFFSRAMENLAHEVVLGPGYQTRVVNSYVTDIKLAMGLGQAEIEKGSQEGSYLEMQRALQLITAKVQNIADESALQRLQTIVLINEAQFRIQQLQSAVSLSRLLSEAQRYELMAQIAHYRMLIARLHGIWQRIQQGHVNGRETGFEL